MTSQHSGRGDSHSLYDYLTYLLPLQNGLFCFVRKPTSGKGSFSSKLASLACQYFMGYPTLTVIVSGGTTSFSHQRDWCSSWSWWWVNITLFASHSHFETSTKARLQTSYYDIKNRSFITKYASEKKIHKGKLTWHRWHPFLTKTNHRHADRQNNHAQQKYFFHSWPPWMTHQTTPDGKLFPMSKWMPWGSRVGENGQLQGKKHTKTNKDHKMTFQLQFFWAKNLHFLVESTTKI